MRAIKGGLTVQAPSKRPNTGKVKETLYSNYRLQTKRSQKAAIRFRDLSMLHMNQRTDLVLRSTKDAYLRGGEIDIIDRSGKHHSLSTETAQVTAIGTQYDVRTVPKGRSVVTRIVVVDGNIRVTTPKGKAEVGAGKAVTVSTSGSIGKPQSVDAQAAISWTNGLPGSTGNGPSVTLSADHTSLAPSESVLLTAKAHGVPIDGTYEIDIMDDKGDTWQACVLQTAAVCRATDSANSDDSLIYQAFLVKVDDGTEIAESSTVTVTWTTPAWRGDAERRSG